MGAARHPWPVYLATGLCAFALFAVHPQPLGGAWVAVTLAGALAGIVLTIPFWRGAQQDDDNGRPAGLRGLVAVIAAGAATGGMLVHVGNALIGAGPERVSNLEIIDKGYSRSRRSRRHYVVVTSPVPPHERERLTVAGGARFAEIAPGDCVAVAWRTGLFGWSHVRRVALDGCAIAASAEPGVLARRGPAWPEVEAQLAAIRRRWPAPPGAELVLTVKVDIDGHVTAAWPARRSDDADRDAAIIAALKPVRGALLPEVDRAGTPLPQRLVIGL